MSNWTTVDLPLSGTDTSSGSSVGPGVRPQREEHSTISEPPSTAGQPAARSTVSELDQPIAGQMVVAPAAHAEKASAAAIAHAPNAIH